MVAIIIPNYIIYESILDSKHKDILSLLKNNTIMFTTRCPCFPAVLLVAVMMNVCTAGENITTVSIILL